MDDLLLRLASGLEIVEVGPDHFMFRSDFVACDITGDEAAAFVRRAIILLHEPHTISDIVRRLPEFEPEGVRRHLLDLVEAGILVKRSSEQPFSALFSELHGQADNPLTSLKVGVFGLEAHGAHVARLLTSSGIGELLLVDPYPFELVHTYLTPVRSVPDEDATREQIIADYLLSGHSITRVTTSQSQSIDKNQVATLMQECDLVISCFDRGFAAMHHWLNQSALASGKAVLFSELQAMHTFAGPLFLPGSSPCWMCYRMRSLANEQDFELAMAYEEHLDRKRLPTLASRPLLPGLAEQLASFLAIEAVKYLLGFQPPSLVGRVLEFDSAVLASTWHTILQKPDCPVCAKKKQRHHPSLLDLTSPSAPQTDLSRLASTLVSHRTGIVSEIAALAKDSSEPSQPYIYRAKIANHRFYAERTDNFAIASGKGMTLTSAQTSCLGEALERYAGSCWDPEEICYGSEAELEGKRLDPQSMVLYLPEQYRDLPYTPYSSANRLGWVQGRSLTTGETVWIPAMAALMDYQPATQEEYLCPITSNGLAGGSTLADAVLAAVYEVLERDAFMIAWHNLLPGRVFNCFEHPHRDVRELAQAYARRGVRLCLIALPTDHPVSVFVGLALQKGGWGGPAVTVGLGAHIDPLEAARRAALEVAQVRPSLRRRARTVDAARLERLVADPAKVTSLEDHALLYASDTMAKAVDFLFGKVDVWTLPSPQRPASEVLCELVNHFAATRQEVLYVNLSAPELEPLGLYAARALIPWSQPIWFGHAEQRLANPRLFNLPVRLGLSSHARSVAELNPLPHPIA